MAMHLAGAISTLSVAKVEQFTGMHSDLLAATVNGVQVSGKLTASQLEFYARILNV